MEISTAQSMFVRRLKYYSRDAMNMMCVLGSCLLGRCSLGKTGAYIRSSITHKLASRARKHGKTLVTRYNGKSIMQAGEANAFIGRAIETGKPFMAARYGTIELGPLWMVSEDSRHFLVPVSKFMNLFCHNTGFFPNDKAKMVRFAQLMRDVTSEADLLGVHVIPMEEYCAGKYGSPSLEYCYLGALEPFFAAEAWTAKLAGKKVLVIHPFDQSIPAQYAKRALLFPDKNILPEFELIMQKSVQTMCFNKDERFSDWFEALQYMYDEAMKKDFDVALIGCGAYGFPLAAMLKRAGKIAIHLGAVLQLIFGIRGSRWENEYSQEYRDMLANPAWVRPQESEHPSGFQRLENGAYW